MELVQNKIAKVSTGEEISPEQAHNEQPPPTKTWILLRVVCIAVSFVLLLSSYYGIKFMQSSINAQQGLGTASLSVVYASVLVSSIALANPLVEALGPKLCLALTMVGYASYISLNAYPSFYTLIPASIVVGLSSAPLWASLAKYNMQLAELFSAATGRTLEASSAIVFGLFYAISNTSYVWGNLISYLTLSSSTGAGNLSRNALESEQLRCGKNFCPSDIGTGSKIVRPSEERLYIMVGCFVAFAISAVLIVTFLVPSIDSRARSDTDDSEGSGKNSEVDTHTKQPPQADSLATKLSKTARHIVTPRQLLLTPQLINVGLSQSFAQGEFTQAFVACSQGVPFVGFVMMCYGGSQIVSSLIFGKLAEATNKQVCIYVATTTQLALDLFLLLWDVDSSLAPLFISSIMCGLVDAVWNSQLLALQGELFPNEQVSAFATFKVWEALGYIIGFAYSTALCTRYKLMIMLGLLVASLCGFTVHNWLRLRDKANKVEPANGATVA